MKIAVLVKQVPDTAASIKASGSSISEGGIKWILSPFDENALEAALKIKEGSPDSLITAVSFGPDRVSEALKTAYAFGVDHAVHIKNNDSSPLDVSFTAVILGNYLKKNTFDLILTGHTAIDSQSSMAPSMISEILSCSLINNSLEINIEGNGVRVKREMEEGTSVMKSNFPVVVSATKNLNNPRYPNIKMVMASKKKQIETLESAEFEEGARRIEIVSVENPPQRPQGRIIEGESPARKAEELVKALREEAKVI